MQVIILAGGLGSRLSELTSKTPKPLIEIGGMPIIWHVMKIYYAAGFSDFIICCGYKSEEIKNFFIDYRYSRSDVLIDYRADTVKVLGAQENWRITLVDGGVEQLSGARILQALQYVTEPEVMVAYCDTVADIQIEPLLRSHRKCGKPVTMTVARAQSPSGCVEIDFNQNLAVSFDEKPMLVDSFINRGFFVMNKDIFDNYSQEKNWSWELDMLPELVSEGFVNVKVHDGFVSSMDTLKEMQELNKKWKESKPWKIWV